MRKHGQAKRLLKLERPLAILDVESTGTNPKTDRLIELAIVKLLPEGGADARVFRVNPERPIPRAATRVHGIRDEDVQGCPPFQAVAQEVAACLEGCDLGGFNILKFDLPLLLEEFRRAGVPFEVESRAVVDAQKIFHLREPRDLSAAVRFYCGEWHLGAHSALEDAWATARVLEAQLARYHDLPRDVRGLDTYCRPREEDWVDATGRLRWDGDGEAVLNFGPHEGRRLRDVVAQDRGFLEWMLRKGFPEDTLRIVREALAGIFPRRGKAPPPG